ncbi:hypothetical protein D3C87_1743330 [compost metagenome]
MFTTILYISLCFSNTDCVSYEPQVWTANSVAELNKDLEACAKEERMYMGSGSYKESDCYVIEGK